VARTRIGLDVGATAARAAEITLSGDMPGLVRAAQVPMEPGAVENGEIRDPAAVAEALKELWRQGGFKPKQVFMGVGNQRVVVREVILQWLPEKELRESLPYQVQEFIPIAVDDAVLDFDTLEEFEQEGKRMIRVLLVAAHRAMVDLLVQSALEARLEPVGLDLVPFALIRSVGSGDGAVFERRGDEAVIDVGAEVTSISVHDRGVPRFVRILPTGGNDITVAVARALAIPFEDAEMLKRGQEVEGPHGLDDARRVAVGRASSFVDEIRSSLAFYTAQDADAQIGRVLVTGGGSRLEGFPEMLQERLMVPVERGRPFEKVRPGVEIAEEAEPILAVAIGLAIPGRHA
jgi:type IV pilus assembly protein PilM